VSAATLLLQAGLATTDTSCESVVTSGHQNVAAAAAQAQPRDAGPAGYVRDPSPSLPASPAAFAFILTCCFGWPTTVPSNNLHL